MSDDLWAQAARVLGWRFDVACNGWVHDTTPGPGELDYTLLPTAEDACAVSGVLSLDEARAIVTKGDVT